MTFSLLISGHLLLAQAEPKEYNLKQGEILDVLLLQQNSDKEEELQAYFRDAFPVANRMSYTPLPGARILELTRGNHMPASLIFGKWDGVEVRASFLNEITKSVPDFHERRRSIWSYFGLTYYELQEDLSFTISPDRFYVVTSFWKKSDVELSSYSREWYRLLEGHKGAVTLQLTDGVSPEGYYTQPDLMVISSWENEADYRAFYTESLNLSLNGVQHVNEYVIR